MPGDATRARRMCRVTTLIMFFFVKKKGARVRGLNAGGSFRRLVARTLAQRYAEEFRNTMAPFNFGMSVHSGAETVVHMLRAVTDVDPELVLMRINGVVVFDHVHRMAMLTASAACPQCSACYLSP